MSEELEYSTIELEQIFLKNVINHDYENVKCMIPYVKNKNIFNQAIMICAEYGHLRILKLLYPYMTGYDTREEARFLANVNDNFNCSRYLGSD